MLRKPLLTFALLTILNCDGFCQSSYLIVGDDTPFVILPAPAFADDTIIIHPWGHDSLSWDANGDLGMDFEFKSFGDDSPSGYAYMHLDGLGPHEVVVDTSGFAKLFHFGDTLWPTDSAVSLAPLREFGVSSATLGPFDGDDDSLFLGIHFNSLSYTTLGWVHVKVDTTSLCVWDCYRLQRMNGGLGFSYLAQDDPHERSLLCVAPNPFEKDLRFNGPMGNWKLLDAKGIAHIEAIESDGETWDLSSLPAGTYCLICVSEDGRCLTRKVLKQ